MSLLHLNVYEPPVVLLQVECCRSPCSPHFLCQQALHLRLASEEACEGSICLFLDDCATHSTRCILQRADMSVGVSSDCTDCIILTYYHECLVTLIHAGGMRLKCEYLPPPLRCRSISRLQDRSSFVLPNLPQSPHLHLHTSIFRSVRPAWLYADKISQRKQAAIGCKSERLESVQTKASAFKDVA